MRHGSSGCAACRRDAPARYRAASQLEVLTRAGLAALAAGLLGGAIFAQYVAAPGFGLAAPVVAGAGCGAAAQAAAGAPRRGRTAALVRLLASVVSVLGVGFGLLLEGSVRPASAGLVVPGGLAVAGCVVWTLPPRNRPPAATRTDGPAG